MKTTAALRRLLAARDIVIAPGAYDAITARLIEQAGYPAVYMTGAGSSAARGFPDFGLLTMSEMVENARVLARSITIPLISDADTGYGNELNVTRSVREFEAVGAAAIHIEDQVSPKRCGHLDGKQVVERGEFLAKIKAAVAARHDPDFMIIARTDARAVVGLDEAVARMNEALAAGADLAFLEAAETIEEVAAVPRRVEGPCLLNVVPGGKTPVVDLREAQAMGYRVAILPGLLLTTAIDSCASALAALKTTHVPPMPKHGASVLDTFRRFDADAWSELRTRFKTESGGSNRERR